MEILLESIPDLKSASYSGFKNPANTVAQRVLTGKVKSICFKNNSNILSGPLHLKKCPGISCTTKFGYNLKPYNTVLTFYSLL